MAVIKEIQTAYGVVTPYNRIERFEMGSNRKVLIIGVAQYVDEVVASSEGGRAINFEQVAIPLDRIQGDIRDMLYPLLTDYYLSPFAEAASDVPPDHVPCTGLSIKPEWVYPGPEEETNPSDLPPEPVPLPVPEGITLEMDAVENTGPTAFNMHQPNTAWPADGQPTE